MMQKLKKGDNVVVLTGKDKGRTGQIVTMLPREGKAVVQGINMIKRHQKQTAQQEGGITTREAAIQVSNLALVDPKDGKATRVGFKTMDDGRKVRISKRSGEVIDG
ncbi:MAG: 50S ribosomal protein L24 [Rhizobiaceae bacterium]|nr:50S ribosomal protein L24 [Rhizobiaceae bacterium]